MEPVSNNVVEFAENTLRYLRRPFEYLSKHSQCKKVFAFLISHFLIFIVVMTAFISFLEQYNSVSLFNPKLIELNKYVSELKGIKESISFTTIILHHLIYNWLLFLLPIIAIALVVNWHSANKLGVKNVVVSYGSIIIFITTKISALLLVLWIASFYVNAAHFQDKVLHSAWLFYFSFFWDLCFAFYIYSASKNALFGKKLFSLVITISYLTFLFWDAKESLSSFKSEKSQGLQSVIETVDEAMCITDLWAKLSLTMSEFEKRLFVAKSKSVPWYNLPSSYYLIGDQSKQIKMAEDHFAKYSESQHVSAKLIMATRDGVCSQRDFGHSDWENYQVIIPQFFTENHDLELLSACVSNEQSYVIGLPKNGIFLAHKCKDVNDQMLFVPLSGFDFKTKKAVLELTENGNIYKASRKEFMPYFIIALAGPNENAVIFQSIEKSISRNGLVISEALDESQDVRPFF